MQKKIISFMLISACLLLLFGCGSDKSSVNEKYTGIWAEKTSERVVIKIAESSKSGKFDIDITWREELPQKDIYSITAGIDENENLVYNDGKCVVRYYENGKFSDIPKYDDGYGIFSLNPKGELVWQDGREEEDIIFIRADRYADVFDDESNIITAK